MMALQQRLNGLSYFDSFILIIFIAPYSLERKASSLDGRRFKTMFHSGFVICWKSKQWIVNEK